MSGKSFDWYEQLDSLNGEWISWRPEDATRCPPAYYLIERCDGRWAVFHCVQFKTQPDPLDTTGTLVQYRRHLIGTATTLTAAKAIAEA